MTIILLRSHMPHQQIQRFDWIRWRREESMVAVSMVVILMIFIIIPRRTSNQNLLINFIFSIGMSIYDLIYVKWWHQIRKLQFIGSINMIYGIFFCVWFIVALLVFSKFSKHCVSLCLIAGDLPVPVSGDLDYNESAYVACNSEILHVINI